MMGFHPWCWLFHRHNRKLSIVRREVWCLQCEKPRRYSTRRDDYR